MMGNFPTLIILKINLKGLIFVFEGLFRTTLFPSPTKIFIIKKYNIFSFSYLSSLH